MAETTTVPYRRLPGRTAWLRFGGSSSPACSLWLGPDHLLKIERSTSRETYKRFFYRDIQSIVIEATDRRRILAIFWACPIVIAGALLAGQVAMVWVFSLILVPFLILFFVNLALGPTSDAILVTAVGTERLSSLGRLGKAQEAVKLISSEVDKAQGALDFAQLMSRWPQPAVSPRVY